MARPSDIEESRIKAVAAARALLDGSMYFVEGCRLIWRHLSVMGLDHDTDFMILVGIDSEMDLFAVGSERQHWNPEALEAQDIEMERAIAHYRPMAEVACRKIIERLDNRIATKPD